MREFDDTDDLRGARFGGVDLSGARFRNVNLSGAKVVDALLVNASFSGLIDGLTINDIEVALVAHDDEESLRDFLRTLGCAYNPDRTYGGYRTWLQEVSRRARARTYGV